MPTRSIPLGRRPDLELAAPNPRHLASRNPQVPGSGEKSMVPANG